MEQGFLHVLNEALSFARNEYFGIGAACCLVAFAIASSIKMYFAARTAKQETGRAIQAIEGLNGPLQFTEYFGDIDEKLRGEKRFGNTWSEFSKTLIPPLDHIDSPDFRVYRSTKRPNDYFDSHHVLKDVRPILLESENLIGLGLILTFLGLIAALLHAGLNLGSANADAVGTVIKELLSTAGAKFFASLGGVFGALIQTICRVGVSESADNELKRFISKLESLLPVATLEKIAAEQYAHAVRQTARLEEMGTEITLALGSRIEHALNSMPEIMGGAMGTALKPTNDSLDKLAAGISSTSTDAMAKLVEEFTKQLTGAGEQTMNQVVSQLNSLSGTLSQTVGQLAASNAEIRTTLTSLLEAMKTGGSDFSGAVKGSADAAAKQMADVSEAVTKALNQLISKLDDQHKQTADALDSLILTFNAEGENVIKNIGQTSTTAADEMSKALQAAIQSLLERANQAGADMGEAVGRGIDKAGSEISDRARAALKETSDSISLGMSEVTNALEQWRISTVEATGAMTQVNSALIAHRTGLGEIATKLVESGVTISTSNQALRESMGPVSATTTALNSSAEALRAAVAQSMDQLSSMGAVTNRSVEQISSAINGMVSAWERQSEHLQGTDEQIERAFNAVVKNLEESLGTLSKFSQALNESLGSSIRDLGTIAAEVADAVEALGAKR